MKIKISYLLRFLNKKGAFVLGLLLGLILAFVCCISVHAESSDIYASNENYHLLYVAYMNQDTTNYQEIRGYSPFDDYLEHVACYYDSNGNFVCYYDRSKASYSEAYRTDISKYESDNMYGCGRNNLIHSFLAESFVNVKLNVYQFSSSEQCQAYFNGEIEASDALNYDEIRHSGGHSSMDFTKDIPNFDYLDLQMSSSAAVANFGYTNTDTYYDWIDAHPDVELCYTIQATYYYCPDTMLSQLFATENITLNAFNRLWKKITGEEFRGFDSLYTMEISEFSGGHMVTASEYAQMSESEQETVGMIIADSYYEAEGTVNIKNVVSCNAPSMSNYGFSLFMVRVKVRPFYVGNAELNASGRPTNNTRLGGDEMIIVEFVNDVFNSILKGGIVVSEDDLGNTLNDVLPADNVNTVSWDSAVNSLDISALPGIVSIASGYFTVLSMYLISVPNSIWALIAVAIMIAIVLMIFNYSH